MGCGVEMKYQFRSGFASVSLSVLLLVSCGSGSSSSNSAGNAVLPDRLAVKIPASLGTISGAASFKSISKMGTSPTQLGAQSYSLMNGQIFTMKMMVGGMSLYGAILDAVISQNSVTPSAAAVTGKKLTITQDLYDKIAASADKMGCDTSDIAPPVNTEIDVPSFVYNTAAAPYSYSVTMTYDEEGEQCTDEFYWSSNGASVKMKSSSSLEGTTIITYDDSLKASAFVMTSVDGTSGMSLTMRENSESTAHGVYISFNMTSGSNTYSVTGYADDNGGNLKAIISSGTGLSKVTIEGSCDFDAAGNCTESGTDAAYAAYSDDAAVQIAGASAVEAAQPGNAALPSSGTVTLSGGLTAGSDYLITDGGTIAGVTSGAPVDPSGLGEPANVIGTGYAGSATELHVTYDSSTVTGTAGNRYIWSLTENADSTVTLTIVGQF